jgi:hypothetical protein
MKQYKIIPIDTIKGGTFAYSYDPNKQALTYEFHAVAQVWFFSKHIDKSGTLTIKPEDLKSAKYSKPGTSIQFANLTGKVISVKGKLATVQISIDEAGAHGIAEFDISGDYVDLISIDAQGNVSGFQFELKVVKA